MHFGHSLTPIFWVFIHSLTKHFLSTNCMLDYTFGGPRSPQAWKVSGDELG